MQQKNCITRVFAHKTTTFYAAEVLSSIISSINTQKIKYCTRLSL
ncbi:hypothetical protein YPPY46_4237 [Yersinia pestis PY-46]|uniref:Uncharacterized protein n=1 Tax=Yersinia pseudotuberculosis serotype O:3 (strain YPIII) TaxID=502800 RepID=A0A0H3AZB0_YERPY|nr:hypothetical protein YPPY01_4209 [Yersinia pestis PY-01]EIQ84377.1 hypothetical protein YPPY03_4346 [Yersinia pestis PY-03]EIQ98532.1 hypothetical protein YPPY05_4255 [Yersinia pestis PY-05]EIR27143.1 hypothetical protein YPPY10_4323 [Yersinia pestis PY-10]EIR60351.1 hypothetical protein YPPY25_4302 [Yersinia pestis PY-25]EIR70135.1 hypothetical protein YPPY29_4111 [Yersinia pestis PY-29]EIR83228.1 hypothetical protein YPPY36_4431 [Yersinia pestis PY-36]EIR99790.1 hypothetical protein YPP